MKATCKDCPYYVTLAAPVVDVAAQPLKPDDEIGGCYGRPPDTHLMPVPAPGAMLDKNGARQMMLTPVTIRPSVKPNDPACSVLLGVQGAQLALDTLAPRGESH